MGRLRCDEDVDDSERINEILFGADWHARPRALIVLNTTAPLLISGETARILLRWAPAGTARVHDRRA